MLIDLNTMEEQCIPNFKGGEIAYNVKMYTDDTNKVMKGRLVPGASIGYHTHEEDAEIIFILSGHGTVKNDDGECPANPGEAHLCAKGRSHSLINTGNEDLIFYAVVAKV